MEPKYSEDTSSKRKIIFCSGAIGIFLGLYLTSLYNYLLFHSLAEIFSIIVACGIFMIAWHSRRFMNNTYLLFAGIGYLFIGGLDLIHMLTYQGMGIFSGNNADLSTQLWICSRYMESITLILAPAFLNRRLNPERLFMVYLAVFSLALVLIYYHLFPTCYIEGKGLTGFKKASEYVISLVLAGAIWLLFRRRRAFDERIFRLLVGSVLLTIVSELAFTFYVSVYGVSNIIGHLFKIMSFYLIYRAVIQTGLVEPYRLIFRELTESNDALTRSKELFEKTFQNQYDPIFILNADHPPKIIDCNQAVTRIFGYPREDLLNKTLDAVHVDATSAGEFVQRLNAHHGHQKPLRLNEFRMKRKDGEIFLSENMTMLLEDKDGEHMGWVNVVRDITERKQTEEAHLKKEKLRSVLETAGAICHELNQPLQAVFGYSQLLKMGMDSQNPLFPKAQKIDEQVYRIGSITRKLMGITRYETQDYPQGAIIDIHQASETEEREIAHTTL